MVMMIEESRMGTRPVVCHELYTDQWACEVAVRQGRMRNTDTHSDACLVPTPDTPPVNHRGREGPYLCVSTQPGRLCKTHLHRSGGELPASP